MHRRAPRRRPRDDVAAANPDTRAPSASCFLPTRWMSLASTSPSTASIRARSCRRSVPETDPPPTRHQVFELWDRPFVVTEHQAHARSCADCGKMTRAAIPLEFRSAFGPRLVAAMAPLSGVVKASRRATQEFVEDLLGIPIPLAAVSNLEAEVSASLTEAHAEAGEALRDAPRKNVEETGWKQAGKKRWLWTAATSLVAFFVIHERRGKEGFFALLQKIRGIFTTDRWHVYASIKTRNRQVCWAHLKRDFKRVAERGGKAGKIGDEALEGTRQVFWLWRDFKPTSSTGAH